MIIKIHKNLIFGLILVIVINLFLLFYFLAFCQYFQQDEWHSFGLILSLKERYISIDLPFWELILGGARVGARIIGYYLFNIFKLNPFPYGIMAFLYHATNTLLVFWITRTLTKQKVTALLAALFFLINEVGNEAYSWFGTMNGSATSVILFLLSFLALLKFIESKKNIFVLLSFLFLWLSFLFKETAVLAFVFYLYIFWVYQRSNLKLLLIKLLPFFILALGVISYMMKVVFVISGDQANYVGHQASYLPKLIFHLFQYPLEGTVQTFFPNAVILNLSNLFTRIFFRSLTPNTIEFETAVENSSAEIIIWLLIALFIFIFLKFFYRKFLTSPLPIKCTLILSGFILVLSFLPLVVLNRSFIYFDSRHYYLATVGGSIILATFLFNIVGFDNKRARVIFLSVVIGYFILHESVLLSDFKLQAERSRERQNFLKQVTSLVPRLTTKTIFLTSGNTVGYYGLPELKVPFQSGLGQVLMVHYTVKGQLSADFFKEEPWQKAFDVGFLYDILGQGYREVNGQGFGYFYSKEELDKIINKKQFNTRDVIHLDYDSDKQNLNRL
ncbi:MAG: hypothetical protein V1858_00105 [Candidatus Gottesmanbacteria bacterium]